MTAEDYKNGQILLVDKPYKWTSFQVVNKLRWAIKKKYGLKKLKVGHAGTLDPLATGLLIICTGSFTKKIDQFQAQLKEYTGTITLGSTTPSYDLETEIDKPYPIQHLTEQKILANTAHFLGEIELGSNLCTDRLLSPTSDPLMETVSLLKLRSGEWRKLSF